MAGPGQARFYSSTYVQTTVTSGSLAPGTVQFNVGTTTGAPGTPFIISVDQNTSAEELMLVTNISGLQYTVTRGVGGTAAVTHSNGAAVVHVMYAQDLTDASAHIGAFDNVHGLSVGSLVVGTTDTQTLQNKTLTSPTISSPAISNPNITGTTTAGTVNAGAVSATTLTVTGLPGALNTSEYVGATTSGAPVSGTFSPGNWAIDLAGTIHICITGGTPGTWAEMTSNSYGQTLSNKTLTAPTLTGVTTAATINATVLSGSTSVSSPIHINTGNTGAGVQSRYMGGTAGGAPTSGTFALNDWVVDDTGNMWVCTAAGSPGTWVSVGTPKGIPVAPTSSSASGTATSAGTETFDALLGIYQWTAVAGRRYRACLDGLVGGGTAGDVYMCRIRNSNSSSAPTTSSTVVASFPWVCTATGGPGENGIPLYGIFLATNSGTNTIEMSAQRTAGTGSFTPLAGGGTNRNLYVEDLGTV